MNKRRCEKRGKDPPGLPDRPEPLNHGEWDYYMKEVQANEHQEFQNMKLQIANLQSELDQVKSGEKTAVKRLSEVRATAAREMKVIRNMLRSVVQ